MNKLMSSWTKQIGYPVVSAKLKDGKLELEQVRRLVSFAGCPTYTPIKMPLGLEVLDYIFWVID